MSVRAKFICVANGKTCSHPDYVTSNIVMTPVFGDSEENKKFFAATPGGKLELNVVNPDAAEQLEVGQEYYIDITKAD
jgi:hypothetical protein